MPSILRPIENYWRSDEPRDRILGLLGKAAVEIVLAGTAGAVGVGVVYAVVRTTSLTVEFGLLPETGGYVGWFILLAGFSLSYTKCSIIRGGQSS